MLQTFKVIFQCVFLASLVFLLTSVGIEVLKVDSTIQSTNKLIDQSADMVDTLNDTLATINRPCGGGKPCGTLADIAKTLNTVRGTAGQIEVAANHEDKNLSTIDAQETNLFEQTHGSLSRLSTALDSANTSIRGIQPVEEKIGGEVSELQSSTLALDALIRNPSIPVILANSATASGNISSAAGHVDATVADTQQAVHHWLHPTFWGKVKNGVEEAAVCIGKVLW